MKRYIQTLLCGMLMLSIGFAAVAQQEQDQVAVPLSKPGQAGLLKVQSLTGGIKVEGYNGKEVVIRYSSEKEGHRENPETVDGMRRISDRNVGLEIQEENNEVNVKVTSFLKRADLQILVPRNFSLNLRTVNDGVIEVQNVEGELDISNVNGSVVLKNVSGAAVVNTVNGEIEAAFNEVLPNVPMSFTNLNGPIRISIPEKAKFSVKAKSQFGDVYTNFDMKMRKEGSRAQTASSGDVYRVQIEDWVQGDINGGGPELYLKSLNGPIYIQKKK